MTSLLSHTFFPGQHTVHGWMDGWMEDTLLTIDCFLRFSCPFQLSFISHWGFVVIGLFICRWMDVALFSFSIRLVYPFAAWAVPSAMSLYAFSLLIFALQFFSSSSHSLIRLYVYGCLVICIYPGSLKQDYEAKQTGRQALDGSITYFVFYLYFSRVGGKHTRSRAQHRVLQQSTERKHLRGKPET